MLIAVKEFQLHQFPKTLGKLGLSREMQEDNKDGKVKTVFQASRRGIYSPVQLYIYIYTYKYILFYSTPSVEQHAPFGIQNFRIKTQSIQI